MNTQTNKLIYWICLVAVLIHFFLLGSFKLKISKKAWMYVYPLFDQNWELFVPPPHENYQVLLILEDDRRIWMNTAGVDLDGEKIKNNEMMRNAFNNNLHFFIHSSDNKNKDFALLEKFTQCYLKHYALPKAKKIAVILSSPNRQNVISVRTN